MSAKWSENKQGESPCPTLVVWVPKKSGFTEFVEVNKQSKVEGGFSIAVFCYALELLPFKVQPIFKPFVNDKGESNGSYNQLLRQIEGKTCEAVAGDVTIRGNRAQYVDFTIPYLNSEVYMLVRAPNERNQSLLTFLKPFTWQLWVTLVAACIFTGGAIAVLEYRVGNPSFAIPFSSQIIMVIWFPISTFFFREGKILNKCSKVVLILWLCMIFMVVQIFTATLSSWLTLDQLRPKLHSCYENVGYPVDSFLNEYIKTQYHCSYKNLVPLKSAEEEYKNALSNRTVDVIFHELHHIQLFLAKYGSDEYKMIGPINVESGFAFAFPIGAPLLQIFSRAIINVTESKIMMKMKKEYLGFSTSDEPQNNRVDLEKLGVKSFIGLFIFMGTVTMAAIISSEFSLRHLNNKILPLKPMDKEQDSDLQHVYLAHLRSFDLLKLEMENKI